MIGVKAWYAHTISYIHNKNCTNNIAAVKRRYRRDFSVVLRTRTPAERMLLFLFESGAMYCASGVRSIDIST